MLSPIETGCQAVGACIFHFVSFYVPLFLDSSFQNQSLFRSYLSVCKKFQYIIMCLDLSIWVLFIFNYWCIVLFDDLRQSKGITETVSNRSRYLLGNSPKPFQIVFNQSLECLTCITSLGFNYI